MGKGERLGHTREPSVGHPWTIRVLHSRAIRIAAATYLPGGAHDSHSLHYIQ